MKQNDEYHKTVKYYDLKIDKNSYQTKDVITSILKISALPPHAFYYLGAALKYLIRVGRKNTDNKEMIKDLLKTKDYIQFIIDELESEEKENLSKNL